MNKNGYSITLNDDEVRAILAGRSIQVQRLIKPQPPKGTGNDLIVARIFGHIEPMRYAFLWGTGKDAGRNPAYQPGDLLWVRETWRIIGWEPEDGCIAVEFRANSAWIDGVVIEDEWAFDKYAKQCRDDAKKAGIGIGGDGRYEWEGEPPTRWRSPATMPKNCARLWLRVVVVRAEQLDGCPGDWVWVYEFERAVAKLRLGEMEGREE